MNFHLIATLRPRGKVVVEILTIDETVLLGALVMEPSVWLDFKRVLGAGAAAVASDGIKVTVEEKGTIQ
jgi:hypothetical protein